MALEQFPIPVGFTAPQAWQAWSNGVTMLRQPPADKTDPYGAGWGIYATNDDGQPWRLMTPGATRALIGEDDPRSVWGESRDDD